MTDLLSTELTGINSTPRTIPNGAFVGGRIRRYRATITMAAQATTDNILLARARAGEAFAFGILTASATLSTSVIAIGTSQTHGSNGQLRAAATFTAVDTPTFFGLASAVSQSQLSAQTPIYLTIATAALPGAGTLVVDLYYSNG